MSLKSGSKSLLLIYLQLTLCLFLAVTYGFLSPYYLSGAPAVVANSAPLTKHLVMVLVDGMRKDSAFDEKAMPNLAKLARAGASGTANTSSFPITVAALRAIGSGTNYSARDILYNYQRTKKVASTPSGKVRLIDKQGLDTSIDSLFQQAANHGLKVKLSGDELWVNCFGNAISDAYLAKSDPENPHGSSDDRGVHAAALKFLQQGDFDILIIHYQSIDRAGHNHTPLSAKYQKKLQEVDQYIGELAAQLPSETTLLVFSDHGMSDTGFHGKLDNPPEIVTQAPFVFTGNQIAKRTELSQPQLSPLSIDQIDLAPTLALLLGLPIPAQSEGRVVTDIFDVTEQQRAELLIANLKARVSYLKQLEAQTGIKLKWPTELTDQATERFAAHDYFTASRTASAALAELAQETELKTKFNIPTFVRGFIIFAIAAFLLLYLNGNKPEFNWQLPAIVSVGWLAAAAVIVWSLADNRDLVMLTSKFLSIMQGWLMLLTGLLSFQSYQTYRLRQPVLPQLGKLGWTMLMLALMLTVVLPNYQIIVYLMLLLASNAMIVAGSRTRARQVALSYTLIIGIALGWLMERQSFLNNRSLRTIFFCAACVCWGYSIKSLDRVRRSVFAGSAILIWLLTKIQLSAQVRQLSKFEAIDILIFIGLVLLLWQPKEQQSSHRELLVSGSGLLFLTGGGVIIGNGVDAQLNSLPPVQLALIAVTLLMIGYLYQKLVKNSQTAESANGSASAGLFHRGQLPALLSAAVALIVALDARCLVHSQFKNQLGKIGFCALLISIAIGLLIKMSRECQNFLWRIYAITMAALVFDPLHICFILLAIFVETAYLHELTAWLKARDIGVEPLYLLLSGFSYYVAYGSLSISALFEEGRETILGAQITDFSSWNLSVIALLLIAKLILVEMVMLLPIREALFSVENDRLRQFSSNLSAVLSFSLVVLLLLVWWQFAPGHQRLLADFTNGLIFIGIRIVVLTVCLLVTDGRVYKLEEECKSRLCCKKSKSI